MRERSRGREKVDDKKRELCEADRAKRQRKSSFFILLLLDH